MSDPDLLRPANPWLLRRMAVDDVQERFRRFAAAFCEARVPHAVVGGQAVAAWVSTKDPDAVRVTKDVDILHGGGVHLLWAGEKVRPDDETAVATIDRRELLAPGLWVVPLADLVRMKLQANRDQDRVHLRDLIDVGLIGREILATLHPTLANRLLPLLAEAGRL